MPPPAQRSRREGVMQAAGSRDGQLEWIGGCKRLTGPCLAASNIKSRVNRLSVLAAITSTQQRLKLYNRVPTNGLIVYCGTILTDEGKEKKGAWRTRGCERVRSELTSDVSAVNFDFEPFKP